MRFCRPKKVGRQAVLMSAKPSSTYLRLQAKKGPWKSAKPSGQGHQDHASGGWHGLPIAVCTEVLRQMK